MDIRKIAQLAPNYFEINREERNYTAIFFAALCRPGNVEKFLHSCGIEGKIGADFGIYFEYAYLRDLWIRIKSEIVKKDIIRKNLDIGGIDEILQMPIKEINDKFGVGTNESSSEFVQSPGRWAIVKYNKHFPDNNDFLKICCFKWSFNIKPDIVIHLDKDSALCIEAKYESREGTYPSTEIEKAIFRERGLSYVGQTKLQKYMMEDLLGVKTEFMFLVRKNETSQTHKVMKWSEAFGCLDMQEMPNFVKQMVQIISD